MPNKVLKTSVPDKVNSQGTASGVEAKGVSYPENPATEGGDVTSGNGDRFTVGSVTKREG